mgnify:CR=1 FL=1
MNTFRRFLPLLVTSTLALSSIGAGVDSYFRTEAKISAELTRALTLTVQEQPSDWLSTDTIRSFRNHLQMEELREQAYLAFCLLDEQRKVPVGTVASDTLAVAESVQAQGYATCSVFSIWWMSDQRLSALLAVLTLLMMAYMNRRPQTTLAPSIVSDSKDELSNLPLTPMQEQLLQLFLASPNRELTKQEICDALWPKKENASETLYTLIHRIKPVLDAHSDLHIVSNRGRSYRLETNAQ